MSLQDFTPEQYAEIDKKNKIKQEKELEPVLKEHLNILILGVRQGQQNGSYELEEARTLINSIDFISEHFNL